MQKMRLVPLKYACFSLQEALILLSTNIVHCLLISLKVLFIFLYSIEYDNAIVWELSENCQTSQKVEDNLCVNSVHPTGVIDSTEAKELAVLFHIVTINRLTDTMKRAHVLYAARMLAFPRRFSVISSVCAYVLKPQSPVQGVV